MKLTFEECETGYATDRGVECYERLKGKRRVALFDPLSTGITFALTEKAPSDKIPLITLGYGRSRVAPTAACSSGTSRSSAPTGPPPTSSCSTSAKKEGGLDKLKGKKIALVYHDSPVRQGADPAAAGARASMHGFELSCCR